MNKDVFNVIIRQQMSLVKTLIQPKILDPQLKVEYIVRPSNRDKFAGSKQEHLNHFNVFPYIFNITETAEQTQVIEEGIFTN